MHGAKSESNDFNASICRKGRVILWKPKRDKTNVKNVPSFENRLKDLVEQYKREQKYPFTAQQTIPFLSMEKDGLCRVDETNFNMSVEFFDISYRLADEREQRRIFEKYCEIINYFSDVMSFQLTFLSQKVNMEEMEKFVSIQIKDDNDKHNFLIKEYGDHIRKQLRKGKNGLIRRKILTVGILADSDNDARDKLKRIRVEVRALFRSIGCETVFLNGEMRLELLFRCMNRNKPFIFNWNDIENGSKSAQDVIVPEGIEFKANMMKIGRQAASASMISISAEVLNDSFLTDIIEQDCSSIITIHAQSYQQHKSTKMVKQALSELQKSMITEEQKAGERGYSSSNIPQELFARVEGTKELYTLINSDNQKLFDVSIIALNISDNPHILGNDVDLTTANVRKHNCDLRVLTHRQEQGLISSLPLCINQFKFQSRELPTTALGILIPFTSEELFQLYPGATYCGINPISGKMIRCLRETLINPNGIVLGVPGSGKSFFCKREMMDKYLNHPHYDFMFLDPEGEYVELTRSLEGAVVDIAVNSEHFINLLDIDLQVSSQDNYDPIAVKYDFLLSFFELVMGRPAGLDPATKTIVSRCITKIYNDYLLDARPEKMPILGDVYSYLLEQQEEVARELATGLELYVNGQWAIFNRRTNVDYNNRVMCFNLKSLQDKMRPIGMLIVQEMLWQRVKKNRERGRRTCCYMDEFHLLLREPQTAAYTVDVWKRFRKWDGEPTAATQNVKDFLGSYQAENILDNSHFKVLLNQSEGDLDELTGRLHLSPQLASYADNVDAGQGILIFGKYKIPFVDQYPNNLLSYLLMSTKPDDIKRFREYMNNLKDAQPSQQ